MFAEFPLVTFCSDAGNWLFCGRKWIDPADPDGRTKLELHHHNLSILFPAITAACSRDRFIDAVAAVIESWSRQTAAAAAAGRRPSVVDIPPSSHTATDSDGASPPEELQEHTTARHAAGPDPYSDERGGWPGPDGWTGHAGIGADDDSELRPACPA